MAKKETTTAKKAPTKKAPVKRVKKVVEAPHIGIVMNDGWLEPFEQAIRGRHDHALWKIGQLTRNGRQTLSQFASGHMYFGLHKLAKGWVFREWAPNATEIYLIGDFNNWKESEKYKCKRIEGTGNWELKLSEKALKHGQLYKMKVKWNGGEGERIPAWCRRVVQDDQTKIFSAQVWNPEKPYVWKKKTFKPHKDPLLIYECHVGMGQDAEKVGSYKEFTENVLPRVKKDGYNAISSHLEKRMAKWPKIYEEVINFTAMRAVEIATTMRCQWMSLMRKIQCLQVKRNLLFIVYFFALSIFYITLLFLQV